MSRNEADPDADPEGSTAQNPEFALLRLEGDSIVLYNPENPTSWVQCDTPFDLPDAAVNRR